MRTAMRVLTLTVLTPCSLIWARPSEDPPEASQAGPDEARALADRLLAEEAEEKEQEAEDQATQQIKGIKFGVGVGATWGAERIDEAQVVDGTVRINKGSKGEPGFWLETHLLLPVKKTSLKRRIQLSNGVEKPVEIQAAKFGVGPFLAVQSSTDGLLDAMAGGIMFGFRQPGSESGSLNLGIGVAVLPKFQVLGDGITANSPLQGEETEIRYRTKSQPRLIVLFSFAF